MKIYKYFLSCFLYTIMMSAALSQDGIFLNEPVKENPFSMYPFFHISGQSSLVESGTSIDSHEHSKPNFFKGSSSVEENQKSQPCSHKNKRVPQEIAPTVQPNVTVQTPDPGEEMIIKNESRTINPIQQTSAQSVTTLSSANNSTFFNSTSSLDKSLPEAVTKFPRRFLGWLTRSPPAITSTKKPFIFRMPTRRTTRPIRVSTFTIELLRDNITTEESTTTN